MGILSNGPIYNSINELPELENYFPILSNIYILLFNLEITSWD